MIAHFSEIAKAVNLPIILYNIPGRTGVNMQPATVATLAKKYQNIVAVKQSNSDLDLISDMKLLCPEDFVIYSGDDSLTLPMLSLGAFGVISVASHIIGKDLKEMITLFKAGNVVEAQKKHSELYPFFKKIFMCPNPVPIKEALAKKGILENNLRLPLVNMSENEKEEFYKIANRYI
jgi:4-hydroxy-tetrahydrodipicolinate synthase